MREDDLIKAIRFVAQDNVVAAEREDAGEEVVQIVEQEIDVAYQVIVSTNFRTLSLVLEGVAENASLHRLAGIAEEPREERRGADCANHQCRQSGEERKEVKSLWMEQPEDEQGAEAAQEDEQHAHRLCRAPVSVTRTSISWYRSTL